MTLYAGFLAEWHENDKARSILNDLEADFKIRTPTDLLTFFPHAPETRARVESQLALVGWPLHPVPSPPSP